VAVCSLERDQVKIRKNDRYVIKEAWSSVFGMWGFRIFDTDRDVFVSVWQPLRFKVEVMADEMNHR